MEDIASVPSLKTSRVGIRSREVRDIHQVSNCDHELGLGGAQERRCIYLAVHRDTSWERAFRNWTVPCNCQLGPALQCGYSTARLCLSQLLEYQGAPVLALRSAFVTELGRCLQ